MDTYILLTRSILDSEVFASQKMLKIWIWCLCKANFKNNFIPLKIGKGERTINVKRGQFLFGRFKAEAELFIDGSTIYKILKQLEKMGNISIQSNNQYSVITVCNYDFYQTSSNYQVTSNEQQGNNQVTSNEQQSNNQVTSNEQQSNNQVTSNEQQSNTDKKVNNVKKVNKENIYADFLELFNSITKKKFRGCKKSRGQFNARLKEDYTLADFEKAITNCYNDKYHKENPHYLTPEFITKADKLDKYLNYENNKQDKSRYEVGKQDYSKGFV